MAVSATNNAFSYLAPRLRLALRETDVQAFRARDMIKVKSTRIAKPAIGAALRCLVLAEPRTKFSGPLALVLAVPGAAFSLGTSVVGPAIFRIVRAVSRSAIGLTHFVRVPFAPAAGSFSLAPLFFINVHQCVVARNCYPCKPDIFEATYERISGACLEWR